MEGFETEIETSYWLKIKQVLRRTDQAFLAAAERILSAIAKDEAKRTCSYVI
jgi:hypothetical protein